MDRVTLTEDLSLSRIVYGMWRLDEADDTSPAHIEAKVEACLEQGITTIDQADIYGLYKSESLFGGALKSSSLRDKIESDLEDRYRGTLRRLPERARQALRHHGQAHQRAGRMLAEADAHRPHRSFADPPPRPFHGSPRDRRSA